VTSHAVWLKAWSSRWQWHWRTRPIQNSPTGGFLHLGLVRQINPYKTRSLIYQFIVRTDLGDLSSGGRFHERAAQYLQGVGPNVISRWFVCFLKQYKTRQITWRLMV
jgi:hypothetical protein